MFDADDDGEITTETMIRLQTMVDFLRPISSIMISIGDGGWKSAEGPRGSSDQIPSLKSFDVNADGKQIFAHYCVDTVETLITSLEQRKQIDETTAGEATTSTRSTRGSARTGTKNTAASGNKKSNAKGSTKAGSAK